ncbi:substrate-binding domain-containing protein [Rhizobium mayense]|uniref:Substrate-binding domain-containing protein n=1 Tax=Rhizobium mayense TaxID=1312184 RepID=A0ABT7JP45_9HYPH|nr:substrate-binding domain-containing protein [Rhizobium mayense]MDL2398128.1 substrate-binding domain-containing protein [Rhizobium mayense]
MIKEQRHARILSILRRQGVVSMEELCQSMPGVAAVTIRRDLAQLDELGALRRRHGGAVLPDDALVRANGILPGTELSPLESDLDSLNAVILPPIIGRGSNVLRREIVRRGIPFIAESAAQEGGAYLGPDNFTAGVELGRLAATEMAGKSVSMLLIGVAELPNTRERVAGFEAGLAEGGLRPAAVHRVNGQGSYRIGLRVAHDAFAADEAINLVFAVNDHAAIAGIEAAERMKRRVAVYSMGGESAGFMARLAETGPLRAVGALFPEVVGRLGIDMAVLGILGQTLSDTVTPHAVITPQTLADYFEDGTEGWRLKDDVLERLSSIRLGFNAKLLRSRRIGFLPHYPAHDWYRSMASAMQARCKAYGATLVVSPPHHGISAEIARLRREIAKTAVLLLRPGMVVALNDGQANLFLAEELRNTAARKPEQLQGVTIVTNSLDVLHALEDMSAIKVVLTAGEYQKADRCLVGPSLGVIFEQVRPHLAFIATDGITPSFGLSSLDERRALAARRIINAAQVTIALADSVALGSDANHRIAGISQIRSVLTDDGALPEDRQRLRSVGVDVLIAGEAPSEPPVEVDGIYQSQI